jgi:hypothetical protein
MWGWLELEELCEIVLFFHLPVIEMGLILVAKESWAKKKGWGGGVLNSDSMGVLYARLINGKIADLTRLQLL